MIYLGTEEIEAVNDYKQFMKSSSYYCVPFRDSCLVQQTAVNEKKILNISYLEERYYTQWSTKTKLAGSQLLSVNHLYIRSKGSC